VSFTSASLRGMAALPRGSVEAAGRASACQLAGARRDPNNQAKHVVLTVEDLRTRVRFPPPPPIRVVTQTTQDRHKPLHFPGLCFTQSSKCPFSIGLVATEYDLRLSAFGLKIADRREINMTLKQLRHACAVGIALTAPISPAAMAQQEYPAKPIRIVLG
jgi:hypothetical protein